ncbi:MAG: hypothetical protein AAF533_02990 [Acidobacteriota bacterium]
MTPLDIRINGTQRFFGLAVLIGCLVGAVLLPQMGPVPVFTWCFLGFFGLLSGYLTVVNFGDRITVDDDRIQRRNVIVGGLFGRDLDLSFADIATATDYEGRAWFLRLESGKKVVLDYLDKHEELGLVFESSSVSTRKAEKPKLLGRRLEPPEGPR